MLSARSVVVRGSCVDITNVARMSRKLRTDSSPECIADSDCPRLKSCVKGRCVYRGRETQNASTSLFEES